MRKSVILLLFFISLISIPAFIYSLFNVNPANLVMLIFWVLLASLCESFPVFISKNRAVSVTFAILLACQLSMGGYYTTIVGACTIIFTVYRNPDSSYKHIFNIPIAKTLINIGNFTFSLFIAGLVFDYIIKSSMLFNNLPYYFMIVILYISIVFLLNSIIMSIYISLTTDYSFFTLWMKGAVWALPNFFAISPIGYFIYKLYQLPNGYFYVLLLLGPLLLARYSFKLYLDSKEQYYKTIKTLTAAIEAKDKYTEGHSRRVEDYAERIALKLKYSPNRIDSIKVAALLHDIGKIGIEDSILAKPTRLSQDEWSKIQQHPIIGMKILEEVPFPKQVKDAILHHHEKYNGGGYPDGLKGDQVSTDAYILSAADAYDAMTSDRPYRKALSKETAINILNSEKGSQFHPEIADILISILLEEGKTTDKTPDEEAEGNYAAI